MSGLAAQARVTKGAMTRLVDGLEKRGWVARDKSDDDGRRVLVSLTPDGKNEALRLNCLIANSIDTILQQIPEEERDRVIHSIRLLRQAAELTRTQLDCC